jgi:hypothetical protein
MKLIFSIVIYSLVPWFSYAELSCKAKTWQNEVFKVEKYPSLKAKTCYVSVTPKNFSNLKYRAFQFNALGKFLIFNSFGEGSTSTSTGARVYHFFPFSNEIDFSVVGEEIKISFSNKKFFYFDKNTGDIKKQDGFDFAMDSTIHPSNQGGLEIKYYSDLYLDVGFSMGKDPSSILNREVVFYLENQKCKMKTNEIFNSEGLLKVSKQDLNQLIKDNCN